MPRIDHAHRNTETDVGYGAHPGEGGLILEDGAEFDAYHVDKQKLIPQALFRRVKIDSLKQVRVFGLFGGRNGWLSVWFGGPADNEIILSTGCFTGNLTEFETEALSKEECLARREYMRLIRLIREQAREEFNG